MDINILLWVGGAVLAILGWFSKRTIDKNERDIENLKRDVQTVKIDYLHKSEFKEFKAELHTMFKELKEDIKALSRHAE